MHYHEIANHRKLTIINGGGGGNKIVDNKQLIQILFFLFTDRSESGVSTTSPSEGK